MTDGALRLITGRLVEIFKVVRVRSFCAWAIKRLPVVQPFPGKRVVLNGKDVNLTVGEFSRICLLPFGSYGVIDGIGMPLPIGLLYIEVVVTVADHHAGKEFWVGRCRAAELAVKVLDV